jgi:hypothetical protein
MVRSTRATWKILLSQALVTDEQIPSMLAKHGFGYPSHSEKIEPFFMSDEISP